MDEDEKLLKSEEEEERRRRAEERKRKKELLEKRKCPSEEWGPKQEKVIARCPQCGLHFSKVINSGMVYHYCKRCNELQPVTTKKVVETIQEREHRGFWQWFLNKPVSVKRSIHAEIVDCKPQCRICKRDDMIVPYDGKHCPVCGNEMEFIDELFG